jgi:hypothetical protein
MKRLVAVVAAASLAWGLSVVPAGAVSTIAYLGGTCGAYHTQPPVDATQDSIHYKTCGGKTLSWQDDLDIANTELTFARLFRPTGSCPTNNCAIIAFVFAHITDAATAHTGNVEAPTGPPDWYRIDLNPQNDDTQVTINSNGCENYVTDFGNETGATECPSVKHSWAFIHYVTGTETWTSVDFTFEANANRQTANPNGTAWETVAVEFSGVDVSNPAGGSGIYSTPGTEYSDDSNTAPDWYDTETSNPRCPIDPNTLKCAWTSFPIEKNNTDTAMPWTTGGMAVFYYTARDSGNGTDHLSLSSGYTSLWVNKPDTQTSTPFHFMRAEFKAFSSGTNTGIVKVVPKDSGNVTTSLGAATGVGVSLRPAA